MRRRGPLRRERQNMYEITHVAFNILGKIRRSLCVCLTVGLAITPILKARQNDIDAVTVCSEQTRRSEQFLKHLIIRRKDNSRRHSQLLEPKYKMLLTGLRLKRDC